jgi:hypothetical protein
MAKARSGSGYCRGCVWYSECALRSTMQRRCSFRESVIPQMPPPAMRPIPADLLEGIRHATSLEQMLLRMGR